MCNTKKLFLIALHRYYVNLNRFVASIFVLFSKLLYRDVVNMNFEYKAILPNFFV